MNVLVVDDERRARERLTRILKATPGVKAVEEAANGVSALDMIAAHRPDAVFLDVHMPGLTGFEVLSELPSTKRPHVVFVTAHDQYAMQAFDVSAVDYLLKPVTPGRVTRALDRLRDRDAHGRLTRLAAHLEQTRPLERIVGRLGPQLHVIQTDTIEAFIADGECVYAVTTQGRFVIDRTLERLEHVLDQTRFFRVHRQAIVNLDKVTVVEPIRRGGATARLKSGCTVEISRRSVTALRHSLEW
jgi:two-component system, LytTR family, response regulator